MTISLRSHVIEKHDIALPSKRQELSELIRFREDESLELHNTTFQGNHIFVTDVAKAVMFNVLDEFWSENSEP